MSGRDPAALVGALERALERAENLTDLDAREVALGAVQALLDLYGCALERIVELIAPADDGSLAEAFERDELLAHLMLLHGLHPVAVQDRVLRALARVRPYLESHGGDVQLLGIEGDTVRLRLKGSCSGCPSSAATLKLAIEDAIHEAAPEVAEVLAEEAEPAGSGLLQIELAPPADSGLLQIELAPPPRSGWETAGSLAELANGGVSVKGVAGQPILFLEVGGRPYGYRPECPGCGRSLEGSRLDRVELICPGCGNRYDVIRAGRCLDSPELHLDPVPLLVGEDGLVRIAVAVGV